MSAEVVKLTRPAHPKVIAYLKEILRHAEAGEVIGLALAYETDAGAPGYHVSLGEGSRPATIIGALFAASVTMAQRYEPNTESE